jgi:hypothetical protein
MIKGEQIHVDSLKTAQRRKLIGRRVVGTTRRTEGDFHEIGIGTVVGIASKDDNAFLLMVDYDDTGIMGVYGDEYLVVLPKVQNMGETNANKAVDRICAAHENNPEKLVHALKSFAARLAVRLPRKTVNFCAHKALIAAELLSKLENE